MLTRAEIVFGRELTTEEIDLIGEFLDDNITDDWMLVSRNIEDTE